VSPLPLDVHLMIDDPDRWAPGYAEVGANSVTFHAEAAANPAQVSRDIRRHGARVGIAVRPGTALDPYLDLLPSVDMILVMTVEPGFGGQSFMPEMMLKVRQARAAISRSGLDIWVQVDGGISRSTIEQAADAGANVFVAGSAVYAAEDAAAEVAALRELAERHPHAG
jgi:ribulose-phosphate 3-epimerase